MAARPAARMFGLFLQQDGRASVRFGREPTAPRPRHETGTTWVDSMPLTGGGAGKGEHGAPAGCPIGDPSARHPERGAPMQPVCGKAVSYR
jgi:hypothetical protein